MKSLLERAEKHGLSRVRVKGADNVEDVRIFVFDHDVVAARSKEEAKQHLRDVSGEEYSLEPNHVLPLDAEIYIDADIDGKGCRCPVCGCTFTKTTFRELVKSVPIPVIIGGVD